MSLFPISESEDFVVHYDPMKGMYRVTVFNDGHFWDEYWFDEYKEQILLDVKGLSNAVNKVNQDILSGKGLSKL